MLEAAFDQVRSAADPGISALVQGLEAEWSSPDVDRAHALRQGLERMLRVGSDSMQDALTRAATPPASDSPAPGIAVGGDCVTIGTLRIPRRLVRD